MKKAMKYIIGITLTLVLLYVFIPISMRYRIDLDSSEISRILITRSYLDAETGIQEVDSIELNEEEINEVISLIQDTPAHFSIESVTNYNGFDSGSDSYSFSFILGDSQDYIRLYLSDNHLKVTDVINMTYRVQNNLEDYEEYFD